MHGSSRMLARHTAPYSSVLGDTCSQDLGLSPPEKLSVPHNSAVQFKKFYRTCSAARVFLSANLVGLSTSDRILAAFVTRDLRYSNPWKFLFVPDL